MTLDVALVLLALPSALLPPSPDPLREHSSPSPPSGLARRVSRPRRTRGRGASRQRQCSPTLQVPVETR